MKRTLLALWPLLLASGCMEERAPIDRTQALALPKTFFLGKDLKSIDDDPEFFMRHTFVDLGYGAAHDWMMTSINGQVSRIRWEITEDHLNARLAFERVEGSDGKGLKFSGVQRKVTNDGQVIASFKILSHFDIKRAYNPTTGEALNVVEENTTDRRWYDREYIRVDWSKNETTASYDFDLPSMFGQMDAIEYEPIPYYVGDPNHPDAPYLDLEKGYFDITMKAFARPKTITLRGETYPACMLFSWVKGSTMPWGNCNPVEMTFRLAFKKVVDTDYEPKNYDGVQTSAFGAINYTQRRGYARNYGMVDDKWYRFAALYNIWKRSHYYADAEAMTGEVACGTTDSTATPTKDPTADPNRDANKNGTADECEAVTDALGAPGSQCDAFKKKCTLPWSQREVATVPWYVGGSSDEDLFEGSAWAFEDWDLALRAAVQTGRLVECRRTKAGDCDNRYPMWTGQLDDYQDALTLMREVGACRRRSGWEDPSCGDELVDRLVAGLASERKKPAGDLNLRGISAVLKSTAVLALCHNPVVATDHPACGQEGLAPRFGDLRYNTLFNIAQPQNPSAWAITADGEDPLTGEKLGGNVSMWTYLTDIAAQSLVDQVRYMNGELKTEDITDGKYIRDWVQAAKLSGGMGGTMSSDEVTQRVAAAANLSADELAKVRTKTLTPQLAAAIKQIEAKAADIAVSATIPSPARAEVESRLKLLRGTPAEAKLCNKPMLELAGVPGAASDSAAISLASPLGANDPTLRSELRGQLAQALAERGADIRFEAPEPLSLTGLADVLRRKFPVASKETDLDRKARNDAMLRYIRRHYQYGIIAHEFGHSVGMVHNFAGSASPAFYMPQYWQLRTKNGAVKKVCTEAVDDGAGCVGPRYLDPVTPEEQNNLIWMFGQSSVMDYPGDVAQDFLGVNAYDLAAVRMFYGDNVMVYTDADTRAGTAIGVGLVNALDSFGGLAGIQYRRPGQGGPEVFHYSELQNTWKLIGECYPVTPRAPSWWDPQKDGVWDPVLDGHIVSVDGVPTKCRQRPVDHVAWRDLRLPAAADLGGGGSRGGPSIDAQGRVRLPFGFGSDKWADTGNTSVFKHDAGADPYEQAMFTITTQETQHIFDNFRRGRSSFSLVGAADRSFSRYNEKLVGFAGGMAFYNAFYKLIANEVGISFTQLWPYLIDRSFRPNVLAASVVFDHLTRQLTRPENGPHYFKAAGDPVLASAQDAYSSAADATAVIIPNGSTGYLRDVGYGGRPLENALSDQHGDFDTEYPLNAGSYYDKINSIVHLSISEDRFVSQSRQDFYDARFRANGMADLFPDGYRRVIANALTNDRSLLAPHIAADSSGAPVLNAQADPRDPEAVKYPARPIGWTSWWPAAGPALCFPSAGRNVCAYDQGQLKLKPELPARTVPVDPQIGWEVQKFILANVLTYIPANAQSKWVDMMKVYRLGPETKPEFEGRIEWQDPQSGQVYFARTFGTECLFGKGTSCEGGKIVQKGIAARVLEYANQLVASAYKLDTTACPATAAHPAGFSKYGRACVVSQPDGSPVVVADPAISPLFGSFVTCDQNLDPGCAPLTVAENHFADELAKYKSVIDYLWELVVTFRYGSFRELGVLD